MVTLTFYTPKSVPPRDPVPNDSLLKTMAFWYPDIAPSNLCLNEEAFPTRDPKANYTTSFAPLFWCCFGGPGGKYLQHLTGIRVVTFRYLHLIHFSFDRDVPAKHQSLGRFRRKDNLKHVEFAIDGPGGERIESVEVGYLDRSRARIQIPGHMEWFKVITYLTHPPAFLWAPSFSHAVKPLTQSQLYTNRGRSCKFRIKSDQASYTVRKFRAPKGAVITGFYSARVRSEIAGLDPAPDLAACLECDANL